MAPGRKRLSIYISSLLKDGYRRKQIEKYLVDQGHNQQFVKHMVTETMKMHWSGIFIKVLIFLLAGSIIFLLCTLYTTLPYFTQNPLK